MKTAIISDIHGNETALKAVLDDADKYKVDRYLLVGDYIFDMPFSNEVVREIKALDNAYVITGNKEIYLRQLEKEDQTQWTYSQMGAVYQVYRELNADVFEYLAELPEELLIPLAQGKHIYAIHYLKDIEQNLKKLSTSAIYHKQMLEKPFTHEDYLHKFKKMINEAAWHTEIQKIDAAVIVFGHNHLQGYGYCGDKLVINPGSCGQPLDFDNRASYSILVEHGDKLEVIERRVPYDFETTISMARKSRLYRSGEIWCELCFMALRTGRDYFGMFFETADKIAESKNESGPYLSNETWEEAYQVFIAEGNL